MRLTVKPRGGGGGGGGEGGLEVCGLSEYYFLMKVIVALISVSSHPMYTVHAQNI